MHKQKKIYLAGGWSNWRDKVIPKINNCIFLDPRIAHNKITGGNLPNWFEIEVELVNDPPTA